MSEFTLLPSFCQCCDTEIVGEIVKANPWEIGNGVYYEFCSAECVEHCEEEHKEYLDSYDM